MRLAFCPLTNLNKEACLFLNINVWAFQTLRLYDIGICSIHYPYLWNRLTLLLCLSKGNPSIRNFKLFFSGTNHVKASRARFRRHRQNAEPQQNQIIKAKQSSFIIYFCRPPVRLLFPYYRSTSADPDRLLHQNLVKTIKFCLLFFCSINHICAELSFDFLIFRGRLNFRNSIIERNMYDHLVLVKKTSKCNQANRRKPCLT